MLIKVKRYLRKHERIKKTILKVYKPLKDIKNIPMDKKLIKKNLNILSKINKNDKKIYYCGRPIHSNLGDQAQAYCILKWINQNFSDYKIIELYSRAIVKGKDKLIPAINSNINSKDLILFQSGYCTTDMHGVDEKMHRIMIENFKNNIIVSLPQTINFKSVSQGEISSKIYNNHKHLTVLARDEVSFKKAKNLFFKNKIMMYPDIVTSLIGTYSNSALRKDILFCIRNDGESYYSYEKIKNLKDKMQNRYNCKVDITDTTINISIDSIMNKFEDILYEEFNMFSKYKLIVTDRYHGTIFSLISKTPVIVLKTNDYKVSSGVDWFKNEYPEYISFSESIDNVINHADDMINKQIVYKEEKTIYQKYYEDLSEIIHKELENI